MTILLFVCVGVALGLALGLFGGGGGILAVPLLLAVGVPPDEAATTSLVVVAAAAVGGVIPHVRVGRVAWREGLTFGAIGIPAAMLGSVLALNTADAVKLFGFTALMLVAGGLMLRKALRSDGADPDADRPRRSWAAIIAVAAVVGLVTGFFGVGGGFLVVPALALVIGLPMRIATATALVVIVINSAGAMVPRLGEAFDPAASAVVALAAVITTALAARWSNRWSGKALGVGFAILVLVMAGVTAFEAWSLVSA
ncbi:MAG: sulfite exporter TauE/SafE family protein [Actinobacteria bacterium]|nr:sulfite exporter TauE/SafE family protein [Actinomycetota bacterium]